MANITDMVANFTTTAMANSTTTVARVAGESTTTSDLFKGLIDIFGDPDELKEATDICTAADSISNIYLWVLFGIGVPGNILTIITILTMQAISPATFFVALLAFFDGSTLIVKITYHQLLHHKVTLGDVGCKFEFLSTYLATMANWMLILICAERFVSVCYPLKKVYLFTKRRSYMGAAAMILVHLLIFAPIFGIMRVYEPKVGKCWTKDVYYFEFWKNYWYYINAALFLFIPFLCIFLLTAGIIRGLRISRRDRRSLMRKEGGSGIGNERANLNNARLLAETERTERTITIMMILAATLFLVFALPSCVYYIAFYLKDTAFIEAKCHESVARARWALFEQVQRLFVDSTHALNFFIYFFTAKRFRDHLFKLLTCKICRKKKYKTQYQNTYSTSLSSSSRITHCVGPTTPTSLYPQGRNSIQPLSPTKL